MILCGLIIAADWIASNTEYFPLIDIENEGENIRYNKRIESAWENIDFPEMWKCMPNGTYGGVRGWFIPPYSIQECKI